MTDFSESCARPTVLRIENGYRVRWERGDGVIFTEQNRASSPKLAWLEALHFFQALGCRIDPLFTDIVTP